LTERPFQVRVDGVQFAAAHFATFGGGCEPLHGHNYEVGVAIDGTLSDDSWVFDFVELKAMLRRFCDELDHRFLLQRDSHLLKIEATAGGWQIETPDGVSYSLPASDVVALPLDNTTAERLAEWFCVRLIQELAERGFENVAAVNLEVSEGPGQRASYRWQRPAGESGLD
jgi:6-pyruvoyltetrahydropterin/6-carboxytetrahydropterin synthase